MRLLCDSNELADVSANILNEMDTQRFEHAVQLMDSGRMADASREFAALVESAAVLEYSLRQRLSYTSD